MAISIHLKKMGNDDEHLRKAFDFFDRNESGYIEIDELRDCLSDADDVDCNIEEIIKAIIQDVDTDKVGSFPKDLPLFSIFSTLLSFSGCD